MDNFLEVWMKGEREAVRRYTVDRKPIPTSQILPGGVFKGVQKVLPARVGRGQIQSSGLGPNRG